MSLYLCLAVRIDFTTWGDAPEKGLGRGGGCLCASSTFGSLNRFPSNHIVSHCPSEALLHTPTKTTVLEYIPKRTVAGWQDRWVLVCRLHEVWGTLFSNVVVQLASHQLGVRVPGMRPPPFCCHVHFGQSAGGKMVFHCGLTFLWLQMRLSTYSQICLSIMFLIYELPACVSPPLFVD